MVRVWSCSLEFTDADAPPSNTLLVILDEVANCVTSSAYLPLEALSSMVTLEIFSSVDDAVKPLKLETLLSLAMAAR